MAIHNPCIVGLHFYNRTLLYSYVTSVQTTKTTGTQGLTLRNTIQGLEWLALNECQNSL